MKRVYCSGKPKNPRRFGARERPVFAKGEEAGPVSDMRSSARWQRLRARILTASPLCSICGRVAVEVHHIVEAARREDLFFVESNLAPVCEECHIGAHGAAKRGVGFEQLRRRQNEY